MSDLGGILQALLSAPSQAAGWLGGQLGIPQGNVTNAQGQVVFPTNPLENFLQGSDTAAQQYAAAFMGPGARGAYRGVPDQLMGFPKNGPPKDYYAEKFSHELPVRVQLPDNMGGPFNSTVKGLNQAHALERAYRNWPYAQWITPGHDPLLPPE